MASYYMMTDDDKKTINKINNECWVDFEILGKMTASEVTAHDNKFKATMNAFLTTLPMIEGTKKVEVCAEACKRADAKNLTESNVVRVSYPQGCHSYYIEQSWFVCKENDKWFQKMKRDCKAKHEVCL